jgi:hypothetical protein
MELLELSVLEPLPAPNPEPVVEGLLLGDPKLFIPVVEFTSERPPTEFDVLEDRPVEPP